MKLTWQKLWRCLKSLHFLEEEVEKEVFSLVDYCSSNKHKSSEALHTVGEKTQPTCSPKLLCNKLIRDQSLG